MPMQKQRRRKDEGNLAVAYKTSIGNYLLNKLQEYGVEHIFGVPGDYVLKMDKLIEEHAIQFVNTTRENTAGYMADAYARVKGLGAACITFGVGINIVNAMAQAFVESSPIVIISGAAGTDEFESHSLRHHLINSIPGDGGDNTQLELFRPLTVDQAVIRDPRHAAAEIDRVIASCLYHSKPVYIEIPRNLIEAPLEEDFMDENQFERSFEDEEALREALEEVKKLLHESTNPVIWAGHELQRFHLTEQLLTFAETYRIPIVSTLLGKTVISEFHPLFAGIYQGAMGSKEVSDFVDRCDCIIGLGALLTDTNTGIFTTKLDQSRQIWAYDHSLKIGHHHYSDVSLTRFLHGLAHLKQNLRFRVDYPACLDRVPHHFYPEKNKKTSVVRILESLQYHLKPEHIVTADVGDCLFGSSDLILEQNSYYASAYYGTLGFAIPAAIALQLASPKRRPIVLIGDGAFQMSCTELATAVWNGLSPIILLFNNHGYGTERPLLEGSYNDIPNWNYSEIPKLLNGGHGVRVRTEEEFEKAFTDALTRKHEFCLIEIELHKLDFSPALKRLGRLSKQKRCLT